MNYWLFIGLGFALFLQRLTLVWRYHRKFDPWGHLFFVCAVQEQRTGPVNPINVPVVEGGEFHYPLFVHWCLSGIPKKFLLRFAELINPIVEAILISMLLIFLYVTGMDEDVIIWTFLLYMFTPLLFSKVALGPNVTQFTTRIYSELAATLMLAVIVGSDVLPLALQCVLTSTLIAFIAMSSKFGLQVITLIFLPVSLLLMNGALIFGWIAGLGLAILISRGALLNTFQAQLDHLIWYFKGMRDGSLPMADRSSFSFLKEKGAGYFRNVMFGLLIRNPYTVLLIKAPSFCLLPLWIFFLWKNNAWNEWHNLLIFLTVTYAVFFLTVQKVFQFLGEGERYISHFAFFYALVFSVTAMTIQANGLLWLMLAYGALYWVLEVIVFGVRRYGKQDFDEDEVVGLMKTLPEGTVVLPYPYHVAPPWRLMIETKLKPIFPIVATGPKVEQLREWETYPFMDLAYANQMHSEFGLQVIVVQDSKMTEESWHTFKSIGWPVTRVRGASIALHPDLV